MSDSNHHNDEVDYRCIITGLMTDDDLIHKVAIYWKPDEVGKKTWNQIIGWILTSYAKHKRAVNFRTLNEFYYEPHIEKFGESDLLEECMEKIHRWYEEATKSKEKLATEYVADRAFDQYERERFRFLRDNILSEGNLNGKLPDTKKKYNAFELPLPPHALNYASDIEMKLVRWLWPGFMARGEITMIDGLPGEGKSQLLIDIAARVSRGWPMPPDPIGEVEHTPRNVMILSKEDSVEHTILPRLRAAKADLSRVLSPAQRETRMSRIGRGMDDIRFPRDIGKITNAMSDYRVRLLIIDPILAFLGTKTDANMESQVRDFLQPLLETIRELNASAAFIRHFRKGAAGAIHRGIGSQAWTAVCRLQHVVGRVAPNQPATLAVSKCNIAPKAPSLEYQIVPEIVQGRNKDGKTLTIETSKIEWIGKSEASSDEISAAAGLPGRRATKCNKSVKYMKKLLAGGKRMNSTKFKSLVMKRCKIGEDTFKTAKAIAGVESKKTADGWIVFIPKESRG
jgi:hypothetical protein